MLDEKAVVVSNEGVTDLITSITEQQVAVVADHAQGGYESAFIRALQATSEASHNQGAGMLEIRFSREDTIFSQVVAVMPIDVIGTKGGWDNKNPTPRKWQVPYSNKDLREKYGFLFCQSSGDFAPDESTWDQSVPPLWGRTLVHPQAEGRVSVQAKAGYGSDKTVDVPTAGLIDENTSCKSCPFPQSWFPPGEDGQRPLLNKVCLPEYAGVLYIMGAYGHGLFTKDRRMLAQVRMYKQAGRCMFSRGKKHNDAKFQADVGIEAPMADMILTKPVDSLPVNAVRVDQVIFFFPYLLSSIVHKESVGSSSIPFLFNPANVVRDYMRTSSESDPGVRMEKAVAQAVAKFIGMLNLKGDIDIDHFTQQVFSLLGSTVLNTTSEEAIQVLREYDSERREYMREEAGQVVGRVKLTTPFQQREGATMDTPTTTATEDSIPAEVGQDVAAVADFALPPEDLAKLAQVAQFEFDVPQSGEEQPTEEPSTEFGFAVNWSSEDDE